MIQKILLVFPDQDVSDLVKDELNDAPGSSGHHLLINQVKNRAEAWMRLKNENYDLLITHLHIFEDSNATLNKDACLGLELLKQAKEESLKVPSILVTPVLTSEVLNPTNLIPGCDAVKDGEYDWHTHLIELAGMKLKTEIKTDFKTDQDKKVELNFYVDLENNKWEMVSRGVGGMVCDEQPRPLSINTSRIKKLLKMSRRVEKLKQQWPDWEEELQMIGELLLNQIFTNNTEVSNYYNELKGKVGGNENFSICFNVGSSINELLLEALLEPGFKKDDEYWMLKSPVCRRINTTSTNSPPLFEDPDTRKGLRNINCLILTANVEGWQEAIEMELDPLENVPIETKNLETHLKKNKERCHIGKIKLMASDKCSKDEVRSVLNSGETWDLVHYAGHSVFNRDKQEGYVFFPNENETDTVIIEDFSVWLKAAETKFVYMSSCGSSNEDFVYSLTEKGIPSTVGYRWDVDDDKAAAHSKIFYKYLLKERSLERTFLKTRQKVRELYKKHIIWAAPVLIMQFRNN